MVFFDHNVNNGPENATQEAPPLSGKRNQRNRPLTPTGALFFFVLAVVSLRLVEPLLEALGLERLEPAVGTAIYAPFVILPLAYAFCPLVFTKRFWHFPRSSWKWICALAVLNALLLVLNRSQPVPVSK